MHFLNKNLLDIHHGDNSNSILTYLVEKGEKVLKKFVSY